MLDTEQLIQSFIRSTITVMNTMCGETEIEHEIVKDQNETVKSDLIGVMGISGKITGTIILAFPKNIAENVVSLMTGYEPEELSEADINDSVTEVLNIICGNSKALVANTDFAFSLSLPTIISSSEYKIGYHHDVKVVCVQFNALGDSFYLYVSYKQNSDENESIAIELKSEIKVK